MSWLRIDDLEVLDDRIGDLTDSEYRAWHALLQYISREANEDGIVHTSRVKRASFSTSNRVKSVSKKTLEKFISIELLQPVSDITDERLEQLGIVRPDGDGWLRPTRWERFNPPRDKTNAERQRRYRNGVSNALRNGSVTAPPRARASAQRPLNHVTNLTTQGSPDMKPGLKPAAADPDADIDFSARPSSHSQTSKPEIQAAIAQSLHAAEAKP